MSDHACDSPYRATEVIAYHGTTAEIEGDFWRGTCFADRREASLCYANGSGWLYTVEITAQWVAYEDDMISFALEGLSDPDAEEYELWELADWDELRNHAEELGHDLLCYTMGTEDIKHQRGIEHVTYRPLPGATVRVLKVERVRRIVKVKRRKAST